ERGHSILELAIGWLASQSAIGSVITGATHVDQIEANARAGDWRLTPGEMHEIDVLLGEAV
ncbi:MAG TPA: aldo/keto reductase, partial [Dehalococcoidia bacterium]|nr:aldo/keto reductase [Dehalococcoidia bacterium]